MNFSDDQTLADRRQGKISEPTLVRLRLYVLHGTVISRVFSCDKFQPFRSEEICDLSNPTHGEKRTCLRAPSGECPVAILYQKMVIEKEADKLTANHPVYCNNQNFLVPITGSGVNINIRKTKQETWPNYFAGDSPETSLDLMTPSGWLVDGKWTSVKTRRSFNLDRDTIEQCFAGKRLYFFGDSTSRFIYIHFLQKLKLKDSGLDNSVAWSRGRDVASKELNLTMQYRSHGPPLKNPGPEDARPYMSDSFDAIREGGNGTIVMFTIGYHFHYFDTDVYLRRVRIIKNAVLSLLRRLPGAKVIIKGLHYHWKGGYAMSPWLTYKFNSILRHEFRDVIGAFFMEHWDYTLLRNNENLHVHGDTFDGTVRILMPYIC